MINLAFKGCLNYRWGIPESKSVLTVGLDLHKHTYCCHGSCIGQADLALGRMD